MDYESKLKIEQRKLNVKQREVNEQRKVVANLQSKVALTKSNILTEHAKIRYLERKLNIDFEELLSEVPIEELRCAIIGGAKRYKVGKLTYVFNDNKIVTITD